MKIVQIRSFFWSLFSRIQTEYPVSFRIQSECGKIRTRKNSVFGHFSHSDLIIKILIILALPLEWKQRELLRSLVHQKRNKDYITLLSMEMVTARHILLSKIYMAQVNLLKRFNLSVTIKNVSVRGFVI